MSSLRRKLSKEVPTTFFVSSMGKTQMTRYRLCAPCALADRAGEELISAKDCDMNALATYRDRIYEKYSTNFQDLAPTFDVAASWKWGRAYRHYFRGWFPVRKDAAMVDVGCGAGKLLHHFRERGYWNVRGVDVSPEQVQIFRQVVPDITEENALDFLERNKEAFDLITGLDIIEHLHKPEVFRFLDAALAALKPGGRLIYRRRTARAHGAPCTDTMILCTSSASTPTPCHG